MPRHENEEPEVPVSILSRMLSCPGMAINAVMNFKIFMFKV